MNDQNRKPGDHWHLLALHCGRKAGWLTPLEAKLGYQFAKQDLLCEALCHRSALETSEVKTIEDEHKIRFGWNERLEFLGDSVLNLAVTDSLWSHLPADCDEGRLSQERARIVSAKTLANEAKSLCLSDFLLLGASEKNRRGHMRPSLLANALEAIFGAIYLDSGFNVAKEVIAKVFVKQLTGQHRLRQNDRNYKSELQEIVQSSEQKTPHYQTLKVSGPAHQRIFEVGVFVESECLGKGRGNSKKEASRLAAQKAISNLKNKSSQEVKS